MDRLLARLERRLGHFAIPNLINYVVGGTALVWVLAGLRPGFLGRLVLDMNAVAHGEVWRLVTFLFIPPSMSPIWLFLGLYFTYWVGSSLDDRWGSFKFNVFYFLGALGAIIASLIAGPASGLWIDTAMMLAFATLFPDVTIYVMFVLPVRVKWLGLLSAAGVLYELCVEGWAVRASILASLINYLLFFAEHWVAVWKGRNLAVRQKARRAEFEPAAPVVFGQRTCAICGAKEADGTDIRVCSCEKCGGSARTLCLEHARNH
jgi:hypothetical protein